MSPADPSRGRERGGIILKFLKWIIIVLVLVAMYLLRGPIFRTMGGFWVVEDAPEKADAIFLLGDDNTSADRAARAAELYREGLAPRIIASGRYLRSYASIAELMQHDLVDRGVPAAAVFRLPHNAANTREEAVLLRRIADRQHWRRVLVVTSSYHTRRTHHIYSRVFRDGPEVRVIAARDDGFDPANWWRTRSGIKFFFMESVAYPVAIWETRSTESAQRGLNSTGNLPPVPPLPTQNPSPAPAGAPPR
jgi:uncharacterized SAM-binding protein YcdF (DUF218 family)